ncbi:hypothetical protein [Parendozoicomonas haliclonae]|uniref:Uncharacterized protein n=1 Tax=Parendozoicomonas haliclonae TaxID=1960125 RepID=A0A1X7AS13_9GAMM|nr:hypothetical protein [Parendozoicomonas haliclonae]SMA50870.1 hypothetical protein EHSB41UT_04688 [Parendozoicomonas haliclonae]
MFSELIQRLFRPAVMAILAFFGLMMLCIPMAKADNSPVLSIYITNAGAHLTYGSQGSSLPVFQKSLNNWDSADLYGDPPNLSFNDSPLKLVRQLIEASAPQLKALNGDKPLKAYVSAAGYDAAKGKTLPMGSGIQGLMTAEQRKLCYIPTNNRSAFFTCAFKQEILANLFDTQDQSAVTLLMEQDHHMITTMAALYSGNMTSNKPSIVVHSTSISQPYLVMRDGTAENLGGWVPDSWGSHGGIFQIGQMLRTYLSIHQDEMDPLRYVLMQDSRASNHPEGTAANFKRLEDRGRGYNNFGHIAGETANGFNRDKVALPRDKEQMFQQAKLAALPLLSTARRSFIEMTTLLYAMQEQSLDNVTPHLIIVGEEANIMFASEDLFLQVVRNAMNPDDPCQLPAEILMHRPELQDPAELNHWLKTRLIPFMQSVTILPLGHFASLQHQAAVTKTR